jgi:hypothetical protein
MYKFLQWLMQGGIFSLVVPKWVLSLFAIIPCKPRLALMNAIQTKDRRLDHARTPLVETLGWPLFQIAMETTAVNSDCTNVPETSHIHVNGPILSPMRPREAPMLKASSDAKAC